MFLFRLTAHRALT